MQFYGIPYNEQLKMTTMPIREIMDVDLIWIALHFVSIFCWF